MRNLFRKLLMIDVYADADDEGLHHVHFCLNLSKDSAELLAVEQQIVRPFDVDVQTRVALDGVVHRYRRGESEKRGETRRNARPQNDGHIQTQLARRMPAAAQPAASGGLCLRDDDGSIRYFAPVRKQSRSESVRRIGFVEVVDRSSEDVRAEPLTDQLRSEEHTS